MLERRATVFVESSRLLATVMYLTAGSHEGLVVCLLAQRVPGVLGAVVSSYGWPTAPTERWLVCSGQIYNPATSSG